MSDCGARAWFQRAATLYPLCSVFLTLACCGCALVAAAGKRMPRHEPAAYSGLAGQSVGVMVWADRGVLVDWPRIQIDAADRVHSRLQRCTANELKNATFPVQPASIVRYQRDHPGIQAIPVTDVAPKLGVSRLVYIEIEGFSTRADAAVQMYRGCAVATLKIVEVDGGKGRIAYEEAGIRAVFPPKSPPEGVLNANDWVIYSGTIDTLAIQITNRLVPHEITNE